MGSHPQFSVVTNFLGFPDTWVFKSEVNVVSVFTNLQALGWVVPKEVPVLSPWGDPLSGTGAHSTWSFCCSLWG